MKIEPTEKEADNVLYIKAEAPQGNQSKESINRLISYEVHVNGDVTYKRNGLNVLRDQGQRVQMLQTDDQSIETGLRLAQQKFGGKLTLTGSQEFQERTARIAAEQGIRVEFADPVINKIMEQRKAELAALSIRQALDVNSNNELGDLQASLAEAQRIAELGGYKTVQVANTVKPYYPGTVLAKTSHHLIQVVRLGKNAVIHELAKIRADKTQAQRLKSGSYLEVDYRRKNPIVGVDLEKEKAKHREI